MSRSSKFSVLAAVLLSWGCAGNRGHNELLSVEYGVEGEGEVGARVYSGGFQRRYTLSLPNSFEEGQSYPILVMMHGVGDTGPLLRDWTGMDTLATAASYVVVFPNGLDKRWNIGCVGCQHQESLLANDVRFIETLVRQVAGAFPVDTTRVFVAGHSIGGQFAHYYACTAALKPAGIASVGGLMLRRTAALCDPGQTRSVLMIHGDRDPILPWNGPSNGVGALSVPEAQAVWGQLLSCSTSTTQSNTDDLAGDGTTITTTDFGPCANGSILRVHRVRGGGHGWPGAAPRGLSLGRYTANLDASQAILDFFEPYANPRRRNVVTPQKR